MSDDLVMRLREIKDWWREPGRTAEQAADRIETQTARIAELEAALNQAKQHFRANEPLKAFIEICAALAGGKDE